MTSAPVVIQGEPDRDTCVARAFASPDYRDHFAVPVPPSRFVDVDAMARAYFTGQSPWFPLISMNATAARVHKDLAARDLEVGSRVGSWKVFDRSDDEIVFGDHVGFMEYRFSLRLLAGDDSDSDVAVGSTAVRFVWRRTGRFYFGLVTPVHRWFVRTTLVRLADGRGSQEAPEPGVMQ